MTNSNCRSRDFLHAVSYGWGDATIEASSAQRLIEKSCSLLPNHVFEFHVVDRDLKKDVSSAKLPPQEIGQRVMKCQNGVYAFGVGSVARGVQEKFFEADLDVSFQCENPLNQRQGERLFLLSVAKEMFPSEKEGIDLGERLCAILGECHDFMNSYYGVIDAGTFPETLSGGYFHGWMNARSRSLPRMIEKTLWDRLGENRKSHVRGVYWASFLTGEVLHTLGGSTFIEEVRAECRASGLAPSSRFDPCLPFGRDAVVIRICPNPWDTLLGTELDPHPLAVHLGAYLRSRFMSRHLLI